MTHDFHELVIGGVLFAPFVVYAVAALAIVLVLRPVLHLIGFARIFSHVSIAEFSLYVTVLGALVLLA
ncbi:DUF1656 domain-containing protein [Mesorhizobium sp. B2-4-12]|uniref:DUF1656 domain-containing protein n=1 Tax=unclassified Mesorhizobium TaxID=325217 RepID=UPI001128D814|nr:MULTISPECIES: DUF1656 domain-containing protein [unclassified Mesorhizobium]TPK92384.1 DUF1656 domain-containing protein [Mesorhizobium sp. B2-4-17]TPK96928.1 DUF1656 domain-containing protein [Mesorhizobium sp. B2-4-12]TPL11507.1 DUF1656 domain-containing protein [Mesorhizobium sp. B2-4-14]